MQIQNVIGWGKLLLLFRQFFKYRNVVIKLDLIDRGTRSTYEMMVM